MGVVIATQPGQNQRLRFIKPAIGTIDPQHIGIVARPFGRHRPAHLSVCTNWQLCDHPTAVGAVQNADLSPINEIGVVGGRTEGHLGPSFVASPQVCGGHIQAAVRIETVKPDINRGFFRHHIRRAPWITRRCATRHMAVVNRDRKADLLERPFGFGRNQLSVFTNWHIYHDIGIGPFAALGLRHQRLITMVVCHSRKRRERGQSGAKHQGRAQGGRAARTAGSHLQHSSVLISGSRRRSARWPA